MSDPCRCAGCLTKLRVASLLRLALETEGESAWRLSQRLGTNTVMRVRNGQNVTIATLADILSALEYELVIDLRKRNGPHPPHHI